MEDKLIRGVASLYGESSAAVRVNSGLSDWFSLTKGVKQGCVMSPWLFNIFIDHCIRPLKELNIGIEMNGLIACMLMFADDMVLLAESECDLQKQVSCVYENCKMNGLSMNVSKTKILVFERENVRTECVIKIGDECLEQVNEYVYLGSLFSREGKCDLEIERRKMAGNRMNGVLRPITSSQNVSMKAKTLLHKAILLPTIMYGSETWTWSKKDESGMNAVEMRALRRMCGVRLIDRVKNERVRELCECKQSVVNRMKVNKLRWFGHVERMDEERLTKNVYDAERQGARKRGRPRMRWIDHLETILRDGKVPSTRRKRACMKNVMNVCEAKSVCKDRSVWRSVLSAYPERDTA